MLEDQVAAEHSLAYRVLAVVGDFVVRRPRAVIVLYACLTAVAVLVTALRLELKTGQNDLVSNDLPYNQRYLQFLEDFGDLEYLYVVIAVADQPELAASVADALAREVGKLDAYVEDVFHRLPAEALGRNILLRPEIAPAHLRDLAAEIEGAAPTLRRLERIDRFSSLFEFFTEALDPTQLGKRVRAAEKGGELLGLTLNSIAAAARGESPPTLKSQAEETFWRAAEHPRNRGYLFSRNGKLAFVEILPKKNFETLRVIREPLAVIRRAVDRVRQQEAFRHVDFGLTGRPVLQADEMETTNRDMARGTVIALLAVLVLFVLAFRRLRRPLLAGLTLIVAIALTFGVATVTVGHLTLLSIVFAAMLVGLGIDFGIHFLARYQDELRISGDIDRSICDTLTSTGVGIGTGGVTTAAAFFSTLLVHFRGLQELGLVAGAGVLICMVSTLTLLPALVAVTDHYMGRRRKLHPPTPVRVPFLHMAAHHPKWVLFLLAVPTLLGLSRFQLTPSYNFNLLDLQADGLESVRYEKLFFEQSDRSTWFAAFVVDSLEQVDHILAGLTPHQRAGVVGTVESVRDHVSAGQEERRAILRPAHEAIAGLTLPPGKDGLDRHELAAALGRLDARMAHVETAARLLSAGGLGAGGLGTGEALAAATRAAGLDSLKTLRGKVVELRALVLESPEVESRLGAYQVQWFEELQEMQRELERILSPAELTPEGLPPVLRHRYLSKDGLRHLVYAYPVKDIWEEDHMKAFVDRIKAVDPNVTGTPIQVYESANLMRDGFIRAAVYSIVMVVVLLLIDLRSVTQTCCVMIPLAGGLFWLLELLPLLGLSFNLANFFALPILIGIGVDGGVHVMHRFRETRSADEVLRTTGSAVTLSFVTTILGFGALSFAQHRGVASLGYLMVLGSSLICLANTLLLPAVLEIWTRLGGGGSSGKILAPPSRKDYDQPQELK